MNFQQTQKLCISIQNHKSTDQLNVDITLMLLNNVINKFDQKSEKSTFIKKSILNWF